jgi:uncharacterized protein
VKDPRTIAKPGDVVRVKVLEVDRISLTMRLDQALEERPARTSAEIAATGSEKRIRSAAHTSGDAMAAAFRRAGLAPKTPGRQ